MPPKRQDHEGLQQPDGHISVRWLDNPIAPSRWDRWSRGWVNLPAALLTIIIVLATLLPIPGLPDLSIPDVSLPAPDLADEEPAAPTATAEPLALAGSPPAQDGAPAQGEAPSQALAPAASPEVAVMPTEAPTPEPTAAPTVVEVAAIEGAPANELGGVPVIMYHAFVFNEENTDEWTLTFDQFRAQLDWFRENDFVMVGMQSMIDGRFDVPAGKKPVILTFDDASAGQFGLMAGPDGGYVVKPDTAVGIIEQYKQEYPEFAGPAFFAVLTWNCFASEDDPSSCEERLNWLVQNGYEVGNHTWDHVDMTDVSSEFFVESIGSMVDWINERVPQGPGNLSQVLVLPFGAYPDPDLHPDQRSWLAEPFPYNGQEYRLDLAVAVNGGPAIPPYSVNFYSAEVYRIASEPGILGYWQEAMTSGEAPVFVSDGDPNVVTIPASMEWGIDAEALAARGLELRIYADPS